MDIINKYWEGELCTVITVLTAILLGILIISIIKRLTKINSISRRIDHIASIVYETEEVSESEF